MTRETAISSSDAVVEGQLCEVTVAGKPVLLSRVGGKPCAFSARCPHVGLSLAKGKIVDGTIRCPWHGSRFDLVTGANLDWTNSIAGMSMPKWSHGLLAMGKKPAPLDLIDVTERDGAIFVRTPDT